MADLILGIGAPGSGKSTILKPFAEERGYHYISSDEIREELFGDAKDQSNNAAVWREVNRRVSDVLHAGHAVVVDATFAEQDRRREFVQFGRSQGADRVLGVYVAVPYAVAVERNGLRERSVPVHALNRMHNMLMENPPHTDDGFDAVFRVSELDELRAAFDKREEPEHLAEVRKGMR